MEEKKTDCIFILIPIKSSIRSHFLFFEELPFKDLFASEEIKNNDMTKKNYKFILFTYNLQMTDKKKSEREIRLKLSLNQNNENYISSLIQLKEENKYHFLFGIKFFDEITKKEFYQPFKSDIIYKLLYDYFSCDNNFWEIYQILINSFLEGERLHCNYYFYLFLLDNILYKINISYSENKSFINNLFLFFYKIDYDNLNDNTYEIYSKEFKLINKYDKNIEILKKTSNFYQNKKKKSELEKNILNKIYFFIIYYYFKIDICECIDFISLIEINLKDNNTNTTTSSINYLCPVCNNTTISCNCKSINENIFLDDYMDKNELNILFLHCKTSTQLEKLLRQIKRTTNLLFFNDFIILNQIQKLKRNFPIKNFLQIKYEDFNKVWDIINNENIYNYNKKTNTKYVDFKGIIKEFIEFYDKNKQFNNLILIKKLFKKNEETTNSTNSSGSSNSSEPQKIKKFEDDFKFLCQKVHSLGLDLIKDKKRSSVFCFIKLNLPVEYIKVDENDIEIISSNLFEDIKNQIKIDDSNSNTNFYKEMNKILKQYFERGKLFSNFVSKLLDKVTDTIDFYLYFCIFEDEIDAKKLEKKCEYIFNNQIQNNNYEINKMLILKLYNCKLNQDIIKNCIEKLLNIKQSFDLLSSLMRSNNYDDLIQIIKNYLENKINNINGINDVLRLYYNNGDNKFKDYYKDIFSEYQILNDKAELSKDALLSYLKINDFINGNNLENNLILYNTKLVKIFISFVDTFQNKILNSNYNLYNINYLLTICDILYLKKGLELKRYKEYIIKNFINYYGQLFVLIKKYRIYNFLSYNYESNKVKNQIQYFVNRINKNDFLIQSTIDLYKENILYHSKIFIYLLNSCESDDKLSNAISKYTNIKNVLYQNIHNFNHEVIKNYLAKYINDFILNINNYYQVYYELCLIKKYFPDIEIEFTNETMKFLAQEIFNYKANINK